MNRFVRRAAKAATSVSVAALFIACGGGGGGGDGGSTPSREFLLALAGPGADGTMTFANGTLTVGTRDIVAVDTAAPDKGVTTVETAAFSNQSLTLPNDIEYDFANGVVRNGRTRHVLYFKGERLYRLDARVPGTGLPVPRQVSALRTTEVCSQSGAIDLEQRYGDPSGATPTWVFIPAPGADGVCDTADDGTRAVRLDMAASVVPPAVGKPLVPILAAGTYAFQGVVVRSGNRVLRLDADMASATPMFDIDAGSFTNVEPIGFGRPGRWLFAEGGRLWAVDLATPSVRTPVATVGPGEALRLFSWEHASGSFVQIDSGSSSRIVRIDSTLDATTVRTSALPMIQFAVTPTRLAWITIDGIFSAPLAGGDPVPVLAARPGESILFFVTIGETLWASRRHPAPLDPTRIEIETVVAGSDGTPLATFADTAVLSFLLPAQWRIEAPLSEGASVILAEGIRTEQDYGGATLRAYGGTDRTVLATYGTVPADAPRFFTAGRDPVSQGGAGLFVAYEVDVQGPALRDAIDLYYFDSDAPGLTRLTTYLPLAGAAGRDATPAGGQRLTAAARR